MWKFLFSFSCGSELLDGVKTFFTLFVGFLLVNFIVDFEFHIIFILWRQYSLLHILLSELENKWIMELLTLVNQKRLKSILLDTFLH